MPREIGQVHPAVSLRFPSGGQVDIDEELVPLVERLWSLGFATAGCCQDFGESIEMNQHRSTTSDDDRKRHADFHRGRVWLKLPEADAIRLITLLGRHPVFGERVRRWTHPEAWQNVIYIFPAADGDAQRTSAAQLTFPHSQLADLIAALEDPTMD
jgi:hypothetical protein